MASKRPPLPLGRLHGPAHSNDQGGGASPTPAGIDSPTLTRTATRSTPRRGTSPCCTAPFSSGPTPFELGVGRRRATAASRLLLAWEVTPPPWTPSRASGRLRRLLSLNTLTDPGRVVSRSSSIDPFLPAGASPTIGIPTPHHDTCTQSSADGTDAPRHGDRRGEGVRNPGPIHDVLTLIRIGRILYLAEVQSDSPGTGASVTVFELCLRCTTSGSDALQHRAKRADD
jgi:hypothetical protein